MRLQPIFFFVLMWTNVYKIILSSNCFQKKMSFLKLSEFGAKKEKKNGIILSDAFRLATACRCSDSITNHWQYKNTTFLPWQRLNFVKIHRVMSHQLSHSFLLQYLLICFFFRSDSNAVLHIYGLLAERSWPHIYHRIVFELYFLPSPFTKKDTLVVGTTGYEKHRVYTNMQFNINRVKSTDQLRRKKKHTGKCNRETASIHWALSMNRKQKPNK